MVVRNPSPIPVLATTFLYTLANSKKCVGVRILTPNDPNGIRTRDNTVTGYRDRPLHYRVKSTIHYQWYHWADYAVREEGIEPPMVLM
jgi:hypothetical protein